MPETRKTKAETDRWGQSVLSREHNKHSGRSLSQLEVPTCLREPYSDGNCGSL